MKPALTTTAIGHAAPQSLGGFPQHAGRNQSGRDVLSGRAMQWLASLPANLSPRSTAMRFPHIANCLAELWPTPEKCREYFDSLMGANQRRGQRGFPDEIALELAALEKYQDAIVRRSTHNSWNDLILR